MIENIVNGNEYYILKDLPSSTIMYYHNVKLDQSLSTIKNLWNYGTVPNFLNTDYPIFETTSSINKITTTTLNELSVEQFLKTDGSHSTLSIGTDYYPADIIADNTFSDTVLATNGTINYTTLGQDDILVTGTIDLTSLTTDGLVHAQKRYSIATDTLVILQTTSIDITLNIPCKSVIVSNTGVVGTTLDVTLGNKNIKVYNTINDYMFFVSDTTASLEKITIIDNLGSIWVQDLVVTNYNNIIENSDNVEVVFEDANFWYLLFTRGLQNEIFQLRKDKTFFGWVASLPLGIPKYFNDKIFLEKSVSSNSLTLDMEVYDYLGTNINSTLMYDNSNADNVENVGHFIDETTVPTSVVWVVKNKVSGFYYKYVYSTVDYVPFDNSGSIIYNNVNTAYKIVSDYILLDYEDAGFADEQYNIKQFTSAGLDHLVISIDYTVKTRYSAFNNSEIINSDYITNPNLIGTVTYK